LEEIKILLRTNTHELISLAYDLKECNYLSEHCKIKDMTMVWTKECETNGCKKCDFVKIGRYQGMVQNNMFYSESHQIALTFQDKINSGYSCDNTVVRISQQGYAIPQREYAALAEHVPNRKSGFRRATATTEELASGMGYLEWRLLKLIRKIYRLQCRKENIVRDNPTIAARKLLDLESVMAHWAAPGLLRVYWCAKIDRASFKPRQTNTCFKYMPVSLYIPNVGNIDGFLDPVLKIFSKSSPVADCRIYNMHFLDEVNGWVEYNSLTGESNKIGEQIHELPHGDGLSDDDLAFEAFRNNIVTNESEIFEKLYYSEHIDELGRIEEFKDENKIIATAKANALSAQPHFAGGIVVSLIREWLILIYNVWVNMCCICITLVVLTWLLITYTPIKSLTDALNIFRMPNIPRIRWSALSALQLPAFPAIRDDIEGEMSLGRRIRAAFN
jgi:hypothetical protein